MSILETAVRRPVTLTVIVLLIVMFGIQGLLRVPVQLTPNVDQPIITVSTSWFGAEPAEIVREIVEKQEEVLKGVSGLQEMTATARSGRANIRLEFGVGVDREAALNEVRDRLRQVSRYPQDADEPVIEAVDAAGQDYIAWFMVAPAGPDRTGDGRPDPIPSDGTNAPGFSGDVRELGDYFENEIKPLLERAEGVAQVEVLGGRQRELQVRVDMEALAARGLALDRLVAVLQDANRDVTAGTLDEGKRSAAVRVTGQYDDPQQIRATLVGYSADGNPVYVRDVATVELGFKKETGFVRSLGTPVLSMRALRETGSNVLVVMENLRQAVDEANEAVLGPTGWGLEIVQTYDQTDYIDDAVGQAATNLLLGAILAGAVLLVTLRSVGATLVIVTAIPIATIGTFLGMALLGRSLNVISMAGLTFAVGMGIDNAIVVLENIFRHREMGKGRFEAAIDGAGEVVGAIVASTLTNVAVFLPVVFIQEEAGQLFRDMSIALTCSFFLYLFVAPTVIPMLTTVLLRRVPATFKDSSQRANAVSRFLGRAGAGFSGGFYRLIYWLTGGVLVRLALVVVLVGGAVSVAWYLAPPRDYLPRGNQNMIFGMLFTPPGYNVNEYREMAQTVESRLAPWWENEPGSAELERLRQEWQRSVEEQIPRLEEQIATRRQELREAGLSRREIDRSVAQLEDRLVALRHEPPPAGLAHFFFGNYGTFVFMGGRSNDDRNVRSLQGMMESSVQGIPAAFGSFQQSPIFRTGERGGGGSGISIDVVGANNEQVRQVARVVQRRLQQEFETFPRSDPANFDLGRPELRIRPDRERAGRAGVSDATIRLAAQVAVDGTIVGEYRDRGRAVDLTVIADRAGADRFTQDLADVPLAARDGRVVPLGSVADFISTSAAQQINRTEEQTSISLSVNLPPNVPVGEAADRVAENVERPLREAGEIPPGVRLRLAGSASKLDDFMRAFIPGFLLAALITYLLLSALLENFIYPLVIMLTVPFAMAGGFLGLALLHWHDPTTKLDVLTMLGFVILIGTVVNNPILITYLALENVRRGMHRREAIARSTQIRVRPIFISVVTTVAGLSPLVLNPGAGSELYRGLGAVIIGGLLVSAFLTLLLTPTLMSLLMDALLGINSALLRSKDLVRNIVDRGRPPSPPGDGGSGGDDNADAGGSGGQSTGGGRRRPQRPVPAETPPAIPEPVGAMHRRP